MTCAGRGPRRQLMIRVPTALPDLLVAKGRTSSSLDVHATSQAGVGSQQTPQSSVETAQNQVPMGHCLEDSTTGRTHSEQGRL